MKLTVTQVFFHEAVIYHHRRRRNKARSSLRRKRKPLKELAKTMGKFSASFRFDFSTFVEGSVLFLRRPSARLLRLFKV